MAIPQIRIFNCETGEEIVRDMNEDELAQLETDKKQALKEKKAQEAKAAQKAALLERLGITEDEAKLLLG